MYWSKRVKLHNVKNYNESLKVVLKIAKTLIVAEDIIYWVKRLQDSFYECQKIVTKHFKKSRNHYK